jgi:peptide-methionine (S)-S-oxide reductase
VQVEYDPAKIEFANLVRLFFRFHDPTQVNRQVNWQARQRWIWAGQGNDKGTQYRSAIFYHDEEQKQVAEVIRNEMAPLWAKIRKEPICTEIAPASTFYKAEEYHQGYLDKNPGGYCNHKLYLWTCTFIKSSWAKEKVYLRLNLTCISA